LIGALLTEACAAEKHSWTLGYTPDQSIEFSQPATGEPLKLDLFLPEDHQASQKRPCIVFFFGGGWSGGSTEQFYAYSKYFASRGLVAISAQYRTAKSHKATPDQCVHDGKAAIRYIRQHAAELGIDPTKIIVGGGSAGGHVAAAVAMCPKIDVSPDDPTSCIPNALVLLNPVYDNGPEGFGHNRVKAYWKDISPLHNIHGGQPPTIVFFGEKDVHVPVATVDAFQKKMTDAGNDCASHVYKDQTHGFFHISKGGRKMFEDVAKKTDAFLVKLGYLKGPDSVEEWTAESISKLK